MQTFYQAGLQRDLSIPDSIATATALTAHSIAHAYAALWRAEKIDAAACEVIVGGGGALVAAVLWWRRCFGGGGALVAAVLSTRCCAK